MPIANQKLLRLLQPDQPIEVRCAAALGMHHDVIGSGGHALQADLDGDSGDRVFHGERAGRHHVEREHRRQDEQCDGFLCAHRFL